MSQFWDKVFVFAQTTGGIIRQNGIAEAPLDQCAPEAAAGHRERMTPLMNKRRDIFVRALLEEGDNNFLCTSYADYKWNPKEAPPPVPYYHSHYIAGHCLGLQQTVRSRLGNSKDTSPDIIPEWEVSYARTYFTGIRPFRLA